MSSAMLSLIAVNLIKGPDAWGRLDIVDTDQGLTGVSVQAVINACS
jgi:hypothetical protein